MNNDLIIEKKFRPEIEGLRVIAALLVAVYHIWFGKVSGGVDVFFIVSGFLITTSLLSRYQNSNKISLSYYFMNLMRRLFPLAFIVLFLTVIASQLWLPQIRWDATIKEIIASMFYYENWQLAFNSVDYLAQNNEASPVQHFWAMSLQGQFYLIWPLLILLLIFLRKTFLKNISLFRIVSITFISIFIVSICYSIYKTNTNQPWAYFDTFARMWEFTLGGILAIVIAKINIRRQLAILLGWLGLFIVLSTGVILPVSTAFPGYLALYPTLGAVLVILAGSNGGKYGVNRILASRYLTKLGGYSYGIYLWHWPILIFYLIRTGNESVSIFHGLVIIILSIFLSYVTTRFVEKPIRKVNFQKNKFKFAIIIFSFVIPTLIATNLWNVEVVKGKNNLDELILDERYPGAIALSSLYDESELPKDIDIIPNPMQSRKDLPDVYEDGCHHTDDEVIICEYGVVDNPEYVIALVGGSHSAQWLPTLQEISKTEDILILNMTKSACRFSDRDEEQNLSEECYLWNDNVVTELINLSPDLVFSIADWGSRQIIPEGFFKQWEKLDEHDIPVFALRDNAWFNFDPAACVEEYHPNYDKCSVKQNDVLPEESAWDNLVEKPGNVHYYDLTNYYCTDGTCDVVIGNVLVYRDSHHITATYAKTLAPILRPALMDILSNK